MGLDGVFRCGKDIEVQNHREKQQDIIPEELEFLSAPRLPCHIREFPDHKDIEQEKACYLCAHRPDTGRQKFSRQCEASEETCHGEDRPECIGFSCQIQSSAALEFRLVCICQSIDDLVDHHQEDDGRFLKGIAADHHIAKAHKDREAAGDETQPEIVTEGVLLPGIRDLERTDPEVRRHEHVLSEGRKGKGKHPARVLARKLDNGNGKYHGSEGVEKASDHVPDDVLLLRYRGSVTDDESCKSVGHLWTVIHFRIPSLRRKMRIR